jgi:hypothetical protein
MYRITIKGEAKTSYPNLQELDGIDCQDEFSEYFDGDESYAKDVTNGYLHFEYDKSDGKLYSVTTYDSTRLLTGEELEQLGDYTSGQWSDGIGEGFEQNPCYHSKEEYDYYDELTNEVYISPWHRNQILTITQNEI